MTEETQGQGVKESLQQEAGGWDGPEGAGRTDLRASEVLEAAIPSPRGESGSLKVSEVPWTQG